MCDLEPSDLELTSYSGQLVKMPGQLPVVVTYGGGMSPVLGVGLVLVSTTIREEIPPPVLISVGARVAISLSPKSSSRDQGGASAGTLTGGVYQSLLVDYSWITQVDY